MSVLDIKTNDEESKLVKRLQRWLEEATNDKVRVAGDNHQTWDRLEALYDGAASVRPNRKSWIPDARSNKLKARVDRIVGLYVGDRPRVSYEPQEPDDTLLAEYLDAVQESDWFNCGMDRELRAVVLDSVIVGTGFWKTFYDPVSKRIRTRRVNPRFLFIDPDADLSLGTADFVAEISTKPMDQIATLYPSAFSEARGAYGPPDEEKLYRLADRLPVLVAPPRSLQASQPMDQPYLPSYKGISRTRLLVAEVWFRDIAVVDQYLPSEARAMLKSANTQSAVITMAGDKILDIKRAPYRNGWHPYTVFRSQLRPNSWWGRGDVEDLEPNQLVRDNLLQRNALHIKLTVNPSWAIDRTAMAEAPTRFEQIPGKIYETVGPPANAIMALRGPTLPGEALSFLSILDSDMDDVSGVNEAAQGRKPKGIESGKGIQLLQQQLAQRLQPRLDDLRDSLKNYGRIYCDLALAEYSKKHMKRILGNTVANDWDKLKANAAGEFDVRVQVGTGIELDPETIVNSVVQLSQIGAFNKQTPVEQRIEIFRAMRRFYPGAEAIIRSLEKEQRTQFNQQAKQLAAQGPEATSSGGGPAAPPVPASPQPVPEAAPAPVPVGV